MARRRGHGLVMFVSDALGTCVYGPWVWRPASWVMYVLLWARTCTRALTLAHALLLSFLL